MHAAAAFVAVEVVDAHVLGGLDAVEGGVAGGRRADEVGARRMSELTIAEIPYENGGLRFRYARRLSSDGSRWIRHGRFEAYHPNGEMASEGEYSDGVEHGIWRDYHDNDQLAAEGAYDQGEEVGVWRFWSSDGTPEQRG